MAGEPGGYDNKIEAGRFLLNEQLFYPIKTDGDLILMLSQRCIVKIQFKLFILFGLIVPTGLVAEDAAHNTLSDAEKAEGWELLFDGMSMGQWRNFKKAEVGDGWKVVNGEIRWERKGAGDIITKNDYMGFEFKVDYKISPGGNSGLMYHVTEDGSTPWRTGPEIQIQDNKDGSDPQKAGWLYGLYASDIDATNPAGEWNTLHVIITPEKCVQFMNGQKYCDYVKGSADWDARVAESKFAKMKMFGKANNGHICLQDHGNDVSFRNIKVRRITP